MAKYKEKIKETKLIKDIETKIQEVVVFDENNIDHTDPDKYEIVEWEFEHDGRRPTEVEVGTIEEDAVRRDFTINALYENPLTGEILDPTGRGLQDIKNKVLRFIGNPKERIQEDALRVFRFYRFLATKDLTADPKSLRACRGQFNKAYEATTPERVRLELERLI